MYIVGLVGALTETGQVVEFAAFLNRKKVGEAVLSIERNEAGLTAKIVGVTVSPLASDTDCEGKLRKRIGEYVAYVSP